MLNQVWTLLRGALAGRATALINILGLATGLCCFLCSLLYIRYELGYDAGFAQADSIYRISLDTRSRSAGRIVSPAPPGRLGSCCRASLRRSPRLTPN